jgi:hypothetical protein
MHRPRSTIAAPLCLAAALLSTACEGRIIADRWPEVRIRGTVQDHTGAPLGAAFIRAEVREIGCDSAVWTVFDARADTQGRFQTAYTDPRGVFRGCLTIEITPAPSSSLPVTTLTLDSVFGTPRGHDSELELTLVLPAP